MNAISVGAKFGAERHTRLWVQILNRVLEHETGEGMIVWLELRNYPGLLLQYAAGLAALSEQRFTVLHALLTEPVVRGWREPASAANALYPMSVLQYDAWKLVSGWERRRTTFNDHIFGVIRKTELSRYVPADRDFEELFDRFEYLRSMVFADSPISGIHAGWVPAGRYAWKGREVWWPEVITKELEREQSQWPPLRGGMFNGDLERARAANEAVRMHTKKLGWF